MKEKYTVKISGTELRIVTDESEEYLKSVAETIDKRMTDMIVSNKRCSRLDAALICAVDYLDGKLKAEEEIRRLKEENKTLRELANV